MEKVALVETNALNLPGIYIDVSPVRLYLDGEMLAPVIGYTGEISKEDLEKSLLTIIDLINYKKLTLEYNQRKIFETLQFSRMMGS